jgi:hypothetical protein
MGDEPGTVPEPPTFSAPDGAAPANPFIVDEMTVEGDAAKLPDEVGANLSRRSRSVQENLADRNMSRRSSDSTGSPASDSCLDTLETGSPDLSDDKPQRQEIEKGATRQISPDDVRATTPEPPATVSLASASGGTATAATPKVYISKRKRKLSGWKLESFEEFWDAFALKKGRADAADAWLDIPGLTAELAAIIIKAARKEAAARPSLAATNQSPKWAQGWLSSRRWEDWEEDSGTARNQGNQDNASGREVKDDAKASPSRRDEESPYHKSIDEAFRRFL